MPSFVNGAAVLDSGVVVSNGTQPVALRPLPGLYHEYTVEIAFFPGESTNPITFASSTITPNLFRISVNNFVVKPFGTSTPIYVANHDNQKILLSFGVDCIGQDVNTFTKVLSYTFSYGGPINAPA